MTTLPVTAEALNRGCGCRTLDTARLRHQLEADPALAGLYETIQASRPHLFSSTAVFISAPHAHVIEQVVRTVEAVVAHPSYREAVLARAPAIARHDFGPRGVFLGFDFHLGPAGPQLIEINTNAGGALLNAVLARAQAACCREMEWVFRPPADLDHIEARFLAMFREEWRRQRGTGEPQTVAIVDDAPNQQYLHPEFVLFERLFHRHGWQAFILDAAALSFDGTRLAHGSTTIDLVYNRLTDFYFEASTHASLHAAYRAGAAVVTPHPHAHALYADKRNLVWLSDAAWLTASGLPPESVAILTGHVPRTVEVDATNADALWATRREWFFKPATGYGSKAAYRGDKLTRRVWQEIVTGGYVAQAIALPSARLAPVEEGTAELKLDVRAYAYGGEVQLLAARLYRGQTTNFRTPGGGFAPVFVVPAS
ncbi:hypothetical protein [Thiobacter aerophilum]|uniref:Circularly permuted type 2 ATP-grasp protein n=1 Tax=Thiobacter aerophilum TaxID=3121275 RepID=A0ABV0EAX2_9BURK